MKRTMIAIDQLLNTLIWLRADGWGAPDETLSARAWRTQHWSRSIIDAFFFWQRDHCYQSYLAEIARRQLPSHYTQAQAG